MRSIAHVIGLVIRAALVALAYFLGIMVAAIITSAVWPSAQAGTQGASTVPLLFLGIFLAALISGPFAARIPASRVRHWLIWGTLLFLNMVTVMLEGAFFAPDLVAMPLPALVLQQFIAALAMGAVFAWLFAPKSGTVSPVKSRPWYSWGGRFAVSAASYLLFYLIFGALNYALITGPYYESHAGGLATPPPQTIWMVESLRAPIMVLSILPFLLTVRTTRPRLVWQSAFFLFLFGGVVPLVLQAGTLPTVLLVASAVEILLQNGLTGAVAAWLLGSPADTATERAAEPAQSLAFPPPGA